MPSSGGLEEGRAQRRSKRADGVGWEMQMAWGSGQGGAGAAVQGGERRG